MPYVVYLIRSKNISFWPIRKYRNWTRLILVGFICVDAQYLRWTVGKPLISSLHRCIRSSSLPEITQFYTGKVWSKYSEINDSISSITLPSMGKGQREGLPFKITNKISLTKRCPILCLCEPVLYKKTIINHWRFHVFLFLT